MKLIYNYPDVGGPQGDMLAVGSIPELASAAEAAGWWGISFTEHPAPPHLWLAGGGHQSFDPFVALAQAAVTTSTLRLLTYLSVAPYRNPLLLARTAATVDVLSGGRMILGLGTGYLKSEFAALGVDFDQRNIAFDETLDVLPLAWSGQPFDYVGTNFEARQTQLVPAAIQQPIPVWIGGNARITRQRVALRAQGWMPLIAAPEITAFTRTAVLESTEKLAARIAELRHDAGDRGAGLAVVYPYPSAPLWETGRDLGPHRVQLDQLASIGVTHVAINAPALDSAQASLEWIDTIGSQLTAA